MDPLVELHLTRQSTASTNVPNAGFWGSLSRLWKPKSTATAKFYGSGTVLKLDRGVIDAPLVYVCKGTLEDAPDASLIESGLPVSSSGKIAEQLPYWPSYRSASPAQRAKYIHWLIGGRKDPQIELGYVFIYFYGLERRSLVEKSDHQAIAAELLRLLQIYRHSRSFRRYASNLLWTTIWLSLNTSPVTNELVRKAIFATDWSEETLNMCLACYAKGRQLLPNDLVYQLAQQDVRSPRSVLVKRHPELHKEAFQKRLSTELPEGFGLRIGKRERRLKYFPASATLGRIHDVGGPLAEESIPNILGISSQFSVLVSIWGQTIEDLKAYDRAQRKAATGEFTAEMYEALPEHLRHGEHPHFEKWCQLMDRSVTDDAWTIAAIGEFASIEGFAERKKLTKAQSVELATTATHMGFAFEPDPRITGKAYEWNQVVSVFPATEELSQDVASYHAAAVLLELGLGIAAADGQIDEIELGRLSSHLETQFDLSSQDAVRLEHLRYLLTIRPPHEFTVAKMLQKNLSQEQRRHVGEFLVGIAAADEQIGTQEVKALGKAYRALGLAASDLNELLRSVTLQPAEEKTSAETPTEFKFDINRINVIMQETAKVTQFLREAVREDGESNVHDTDLDDEGTVEETVHHIKMPIADVPTPTLVVSSETVTVENQDVFPLLPARLRPFLKEALTQSQWTRTALDYVARSHRLMIGSAIEQINEWSCEELGDLLLVEQGDEIEVQHGLLE